MKIDPIGFKHIIQQYIFIKRSFLSPPGAICTCIAECVLNTFFGGKKIARKNKNQWRTPNTLNCCRW